MLWMNWGPSPQRPDMAYSVEDDTYIALYGVWQDPARRRRQHGVGRRSDAGDGAASQRDPARRREPREAPGALRQRRNLARLDEVRAQHDPEGRFHPWMAGRAVSLDAYLEATHGAGGAGCLDAIRAGPIDTADALTRDDLDRLPDPAPLAGGDGLVHGCGRRGYVAVRTAMPAVTGKMADWGFDWHPDDPPLPDLAPPGATSRTGWSGLRRRARRPTGERSITRSRTSGVWQVPGADRVPAPTELGISTTAHDPVATIVCGRPGDERPPRAPLADGPRVPSRAGGVVLPAISGWVPVPPYLPRTARAPVAWAC